MQMNTYGLLFIHVQYNSYYMRALFLKSQQDRQQSSLNKNIIYKLEQNTERSQSRPIVLLSLRKPNKLSAKQSIRQAFENNKRYPYFMRHQQQRSKTDPTETRFENQHQDIFKLNLINLISKSTPYVTIQSKYSPTTISKKMKQSFRINKEINTSHKRQIPANKQDYIKIDQQQKLPSSKVQQQTIKNNDGIKSRKNKVTFYMNNFMKTKYSKPRKISLDSDYNKNKTQQQNTNTQKNGFFPWDRSLDSQQDVQIPH